MRNQLAAISLMFFLQFFGYTLAEAFLSFYTSAFLTVFEISMLVLGVYVTFAIATLFSGKIVEQYGTVVSIRVGALLYVPLLFILTFSTNFWLLLLGALLVGIGASTLWTGGKTFVLRNFSKRGEAYGIFNGFGIFGSALAGLIGGWLSFHYLLTDIFALGGASILAAVAVSFLLVDRKDTRTIYPLSEQWKLFRNRNLLLLAAVGLIGSLFSGLIIPLGALIVKSLGGQAFEVGLVTFSSLTLGFMSMVFSGRVSDRIGRKPVIYFTLAIGALSSFLLYLSINYWMVLAGAVMYAVCWWGCLVVLTVTIGDLFKKKLALAMVVFNFFLTVGVSIGALLAGVLSFESLRFPFLVLGILLLLSLLVVREVRVK